MIDDYLFIRAINNDTEALMELGNLYYIGSEGEENKEKAVFFFGKAVENALNKAEHSDTSELEAVIGFLKKYSSGDAETSETAKKKIAIRKNDMKDIFSSSKNADRNRATVFRNDGKKHLKNEEYEDAVVCFAKAIEFGDDESQTLLAKAKINLAYRAYYGTDDKPDYVKSERYFKEVAESGDERFTVEAKMCLAELYSTRLDRKEEAVEIWQELASNGNADAQYNYGLALFNGMGIERDEERGVYWWQKAAQNGHADAKYNVDVFFSNI